MSGGVPVEFVNVLKCKLEHVEKGLNESVFPYLCILRIPLTRQEEVKIDLGLTEFHWTPDLF